MQISRLLIQTLLSLLAALVVFPSPGHAQALKKVRMASSSTNVSFLALYTALHRGFFKDEGIDLEIIFMPANLASTAVLNGDVDFNGAVTGTIGAAVQGRPMKVLLFTVAKPLLFLMGRKDIKDVKQLKGKKIAGSSPGGSATLLKRSRFAADCSAAYACDAASTCTGSGENSASNATRNRP